MIETERLLLREPRMDDAEALMAVFGDCEAMRYIGDGSVRTLEVVRERMQRKLASLREHGVTLYTVEVRETGEIIGDCGACPIDWKGPDLELGYRLRPSAWGKGYATEAGRAAVAYVFRATQIGRLLAVTDLRNTASQRVLAKLGFVDRGMTDVYYGETLRLFEVLRA